MNKVLSCLAAMILCVSTLVAHDAGRDVPLNSIGALAAYLELSEVQVQALQELQAQFVEEIKGIQEEIREKKQQVKAELQSEFPDANLIGQLMIEIKELNEQKKVVKQEFQGPALEILEEEQIRLLGPLRRALRLALPAHQAVHFHLIGGGDGSDEAGSDESLL